MQYYCIVYNAIQYNSNTMKLLLCHTIQQTTIEYHCIVLYKTTEWYCIVWQYYFIVLHVGGIGGATFRFCSKVGLALLFLNYQQLPEVTSSKYQHRARVPAGILTELMGRNIVVVSHMSVAHVLSNASLIEVSF